jgi:enterochelin esterase-like enzyme
MLFRFRFFLPFLLPVSLLLLMWSRGMMVCDAVKPSSKPSTVVSASLSSPKINNVYRPNVTSLTGTGSDPSSTKQLRGRRRQPPIISPPEPRRELQPPFPNGPCGGTVVEIAPDETFGVDVNLANTNVMGDLMLLPRPIKIWLPPGYNDETFIVDDNNENSNEGRGHPVLYVHDGQNAMEDAESWTGASWRLMGALTRLADHQLLSSKQPMPLVVLIPSAPGDLLLPGIRRRHLEYGDCNFPFSQAHADFVAQTVKPLVDNRFRTNPAPDATFAIGSSLGGQASLHLLLRHANKFGGAACLSPAFGPAILDQVRKTGDILMDKRIYLDIGGDSDEIRVPLIDFFDHMTPEHWWNPGYFWLDNQLQGQVTSMRQALDQVGVPYSFRQFPGGRHNERGWAQRIDVPLRYLFGTKQEGDVALH